MVVACTSAGVALAASGCLSGDDTSAPLTPGLDSGLPPTPIFDASGVVEGASPPGPEAGVDAAATDASAPDGATAGGASTLGLVAGGVLSQSTHYTLIGATGPATAPVLQSPKYQLTGGMAATK
jgi:hypothetical protein